MSFGRDKYQVYENIVNLKLAKSDANSAFHFVRTLKSRTLIRSARKKSRDRVGHPALDESPPVAAHPEAPRRAQHLFIAG